MTLVVVGTTALAGGGYAYNYILMPLKYILGTVYSILALLELALWVCYVHMYTLWHYFKNTHNFKYLWLHHNALTKQRYGSQNQNKKGQVTNGSSKNLLQ
jgi:hypothetical protein